MGLKASRSDLIAFQWPTNGICADFSLPDDQAHLLRVLFNRLCIVHLLGSGRVDHSQTMPVAARAPAEKKTVGHGS